VKRREEEANMNTALRWTSADLTVLPDDGKRYEIIDGELYISRQPHWHHQRACGKICAALEAWSMQTGAGETNLAPGIIFAEDDDVAPDVVWISHTRGATALERTGICTPRQNWLSKSCYLGYQRATRP
jgi:Uma2 family endonuclease